MHTCKVWGYCIEYTLCTAVTQSNGEVLDKLRKLHETGAQLQEDVHMSALKYKTLQGMDGISNGICMENFQLIATPDEARVKQDSMLLI